MEDTDITLEDIEDAFGTGVRDLVDAMSEDKDVEPWEASKTKHRDEVEAAGGARSSSMPPTRSPTSETCERSTRTSARAPPSRFNAPLDSRLRVWRGDAEMIERVHPGLDIADQLRAELDAFEAERATTA